MHIALNLINQSSAITPPAICIVHKDLLADCPPPLTVWTVVRRCAPGWCRPLRLSQVAEVSLGDAYGNFSRRRPAPAGSVFAVTGQHDGPRLAATGQRGRPDQVVVRNELPDGAVDVHLFNDRRLLGSRRWLAPGQAAVFHVAPVLWIGALGDGERVAESQSLPRALQARLDTRLDLHGVASADIVMHGGGTDTLRFSLQHVRPL